MSDPRTILVTGASSGIGAAIALRFAQDGHRVFGTTRRLSNLAKAPAELQAVTAGNKDAERLVAHAVRIVELDVTRDESVKNCVLHVLEEAGRIDVLVNNAGWGTFGPVEELPVDLARELFETNVFGALRMIQAVMPNMRRRRSGLIINVTSIAAEAVIPFQAHYSASKAALRSLTIGLRMETRPFGIQVCMIEPSDINTRFNDVTQFGQGVESAYKPWTESCWRIIAENLAKSPPPSVIAATAARIVKRKKPRTIYTSGIFLQRLSPLIFRIIPQSWQQAALRMFYGVSGKSAVI